MARSSASTRWLAESLMSLLNSTVMALSPLGKRRGGAKVAAMVSQNSSSPFFAQTNMLVTPPVTLDAGALPRKMRPPIHPPGACFPDVPDPRSDRDAVARDHRHHHHGPAEKGPAKRLDAGCAPAAAGSAASGRVGVHAPLRAGPRG